MNKSIIFLWFVLLACTTGFAQSKLTVQVNKPVADIQPTMWGIFFEDINFGADGGLYAELVKNRSFEFSQPLMGWKIMNENNGSVLILNRSAEKPSNPRYAQISVNEKDKPFGLTNEGFQGMGIKKDNKYTFSLQAKMNKGFAGTVRVELISSDGKKIGNASLEISGNDWKKYSADFVSTATDNKAHLVVWFEGKGVYDTDMISLFPNDTWKNRPGGLRADLVQLLADLKPGFIRFPGGCIVEGRDLANRYQWKHTVGQVDKRQLIINRWNTEFAHRPAPDYFQSFGLGFYEYFLLAEDIGAEPLPIVNCGMACQFNSAEAVDTAFLDPYIQDALDLIEFANGSTNTQWGKLRADMGHPDPFNLKMMGIGNENWGSQYIDRLKMFAKAIKSKYPAIRFVNSSGTDPDGERFDYLNGELRKMNADIIDEHYYRTPDWFLSNARRYDSYPRNGSKVFAGEYAAQSDKTVSIHNRNNWKCALAEAAFMTGLERNAAVVVMSSYAPLFAHVDRWQWTPDLIWFDNLRSYGTPNYYVQKLFSIFKGTQVVPVLSNNDVVAGQDGLYASACIDKNKNELIIKLVNASSKTRNDEINLTGLKKSSSKARETTLQSNDLEQCNSLDNPTAISPMEQTMDIKGNSLKINLKPYSFTILRIDI